MQPRGTMALRDRILPLSMPRTLKARIAAKAYPQIYKIRERIPRYSLHEQAKTFSARARERGLGDVGLYYWYHTVDLGDGLVTPGLHDYRSKIDEFCFPHDMSGMNVLDVGSATGFFSFEFEKRGANVVSVEVPSLSEVDRFPYQDEARTAPKIAAMVAGHSSQSRDDFDTVFNKSNSEDVYHYVLDGPFNFCREALGSQVERRYASIYDLSPAALGVDKFDLVFLGDLLLHTMHPLNALAAVTPLCDGTLVISQHLPTSLGSRPAVLYVGGDNPIHDHSTWWYPNLACFEQVLKKLGFEAVTVVGRNVGASRPGGVHYDRPILHASRDVVARRHR